MGIKRETEELADKIIQEEIRKEGRSLEEELGRSDFLESPDSDVHEEFGRLKQAMEEKQKNEDGAAEEAQKQKTAGRKKLVFAMKAALLFLVAGGCLFLFSTSSEANRMWWMKSAEHEVGDESGTVLNNDDNRVKSELTEKEAAKKIEEETGIPVPEFVYLPEGMRFDSFEYDPALDFAFMYYSMEGHIITLYMQAADANSSSDLNYDGEAAEKKEIKTAYAPVIVKRAKKAGDADFTTIAEWIYKNASYRICGKTELELVENIVKHICY